MLKNDLKNIIKKYIGPNDVVEAIAKDIMDYLDDPRRNSNSDIR